MKKLLNVAILFALIIFIGCSKDEETDNGSNSSSNFNIENISGSEWTRGYYGSLDPGDDGTWEDATYVLTFTSSSKAEIYCKYNGYEWTWSPSSGDQYKSYSGNWTDYYNYTVSGSTINMIPISTSDSSSSMTLKLSGGNLVSEYDTWNLVSQ